MRRMGIGAAVLMGALLSSQLALADRYGSRTGVAGRAGDAAGSAALQVPRFSSPAWIDAGRNPFRMVAADLNRDGNADLAVVEWSGAAVSVMLGDGTGQFGPRAAYRTGRSPWGLAASDLNGDGKLDLATASASASKSITVFINRGSGRYRRAGAYAAGRDARGIAAGDVNQDGVVDLLSAHASRKQAPHGVARTARRRLPGRLPLSRRGRLRRRRLRPQRRRQARRRARRQRSQRGHRPLGPRRWDVQARAHVPLRVDAVRCRGGRSQPRRQARHNGRQPRGRQRVRVPWRRRRQLRRAHSVPDGLRG